MGQLLGYAIVTHTRSHVWCGPGLWPWQRLPRPPTLWESKNAAQRAAGALMLVLRVRLTVVPLRAP